MLTPFILLPLFFSIGCGDTTNAVGLNGRIDYVLWTKYELGDQKLTDLSIITGHEQYFITSLTEKGQKDIEGRADEIKHRLSPEKDSSIANVDDFSLGAIPDLVFTVPSPGRYTLNSKLDGDVFDYLPLTFKSPDSLELVTWIKNPEEDDFSKQSGGLITVKEGAQATFLPIPKSNGKRLAGDISFEMASDPETATVEVYNLVGVYENEITYSTSPTSVVFLEPGKVIVTLIDVPNGVSSFQAFDVIESDE